MLNAFIDRAKPGSTFTAQITDFVRCHGAINNSFLTRFSEGDATQQECIAFAEEFFHFSRHFPLVLCTLLVHTPDEKDAEELTKILVSELGDGIPRRRHELLERHVMDNIKATDPARLLAERIYSGLVYSETLLREREEYDARPGLCPEPLWHLED